MFDTTSFDAIKNNSETMELTTKISLIEGLCKNISFQVQWATRNEEKRTRAAESGLGSPSDDNDDAERVTMRRVIDLSMEVMEFIDIDIASNLPTHKLDSFIRGSLLGLYRLPSVTKWFETETLAFFDWWGRHIVTWSKRPVSHAFHRLYWRHLRAMIVEMRDHLRPSPKGRAYHLKRRRRSFSGTERRHSYYSAQRIPYEKISPLGRTLSSYLSDLANFPSRITSYHGKALWFLKELLDEEEQSSSVQTIDYFCMMQARCGKRKRSLPVSCLSPKDPRVEPGIAFALKLLVDRYEENKENLWVSSSLLGEACAEGLHRQDSMGDEHKSKKRKAESQLVGTIIRC